MDLVDLLVLEVCDDGSFWGTASEDLYPEIETRIAACEKKPMCDGVRLGDKCLVRSCITDEGVKWSRAKVCSVMSSRIHSHIELFLIDYGTSVVFPLQSLCVLPTDLEGYPPLAQQFFLKGLKPIAQERVEQWGLNVKRLLKELCKTDKIVVKAEIDSKSNAILHLNEEVNVNEYLISSQLATAVECLDTFQVCEEDSDGDGDETCAKTSDHVRATVDEHPAARVTSCFVDVKTTLTPVSMESAGISMLVMSELKNLGMRQLTVAQSYSLPYIANGQNTVLVSPSLSGKTLSYLLPVLSHIGSHSKAINSIKPSLLILIATSWQARSVELQIKKIFSWMNSERQMRCCCAYYASEIQAMYSLYNGIDVLISTPSTALKLYKKCDSLLNQISYLVLDDFSLLRSSFADDMEKVIKEVTYHKIPQIVALASSWSKEIAEFMDQHNKEHVCIITDPVEVVIKSQICLSLVISFKSKIQHFLDQIIDRESLVICASTVEEASMLYEVLQVNSWSPRLLLKENVAKFNCSSCRDKLIVVTDDVLTSGCLEGLCITHVLQHTPPRNKVLFGLRLSLLYKALLQKLKCKCTVLFDENWRRQSILLKDMLDRLQLPVPQQVQEMASKQLKVKEDSKSGYDICYHIKAWGQCRKLNCPSRHAVSSAPSGGKPVVSSVVLPTDGVIKVKVVHVSNASRLWVSLLEHNPISRPTATVTIHNPIQFKKLCLDLAHYYSNKENRKYHVPGSLYEGCYCGYQSDSGSIFRARVLKFSQPLGLFFPHKQKAQIRCIDIGSSEVVDANQLLYLPERFFDSPAQVVEVYISGVRPKDNDLDWTTEALEYSRRMLEGKIMYGEVAVAFEQTLWLKVLEYKKLLPDIRVSTSLYSPAQELLKVELAELNTDHLSQLQELFSQHQLHSTVTFVKCKEGSSRDVLVTAVDSPSFFYVQPSSCSSSLEKIEESLEENLSAPGKLEVGDVCCAFSEMNKRWYRGQVLSAKADEFEVFFVDYGDVEWIVDTKVLPLQQSLLKVPFQAILCSLGTDEEFTRTDVIDKFWDITRGEVFTMEVKQLCSQLVGELWKHLVVLREKKSNQSIAAKLKIVSTEEDTYQEEFPLDNTLSSLLTSMKESSSEATLEQYAEEMFCVTLENPKLAAIFDEVSCVCRLLLSIEGVNTKSYLLRFLCLLAMYHDRIRLTPADVIAVTNCLTSQSSDIVELTLLLLKALVPSSRSLVFTRECIFHLCTCLKDWSKNTVIFQHVLDMLYITDKDLLFDASIGCKILDILLDSNLNLHPFSKSLVVIISRIVSCLGPANSSRYHFKHLLPRDTDNLVTMCCMNIWSYGGHTREAVHISDPVLEFIWSLTDGAYVQKPSRQYTTSLPLLPQQVYHPKIQWSQDNLRVLLAVQISGCRRENISISTHGVSSVCFQAVVGSKKYSFELTLFSSVAQEFAVKVLMCEILVTFTKLDSSEWPRLVYSSEKNNFLVHDLDRLQGESVITYKSGKYPTFRVEDDDSDDEGSSEEDEERDLQIGDCHFLYDQM